MDYLPKNIWPWCLASTFRYLQEMLIETQIKWQPRLGPWHLIPALPSRDISQVGDRHRCAWSLWSSVEFRLWTLCCLPEVTIGTHTVTATSQVPMIKAKKRSVIHLAPTKWACLCRFSFRGTTVTCSQSSVSISGCTVLQLVFLVVVFLC